MGDDYVPVIDEHGELAWQGPDGELYVMTDHEQRELRLSALEQQAAALRQQDYLQDEEQTPEELDQAILEALSAEDRRRGAKLTHNEVKRFATHVYETGEKPDEDDWQPHDLDDREGRRQWMAERVSDAASEGGE